MCPHSECLGSDNRVGRPVLYPPGVSHLFTFEKRQPTVVFALQHCELHSNPGGRPRHEYRAPGPALPLVGEHVADRLEGLPELQPTVGFGEAVDQSAPSLRGAVRDLLLGRVGPEIFKAAADPREEEREGDNDVGDSTNRRSKYVCGRGVGGRAVTSRTCTSARRVQKTSIRQGLVILSPSIYVVG